MRVLVIANQDDGGYFYQLAYAARAARMASVRLITLNTPGVAAFPTDLCKVHDGGVEVRTLMHRAEVIHLVDLLPEQVCLFQEPLVERLEAASPPRLVVQFTRKLTVRMKRQVADVRARGGGCLVTKPGLLPREQASFLPPFIPLYQAPWLPVAEGTRPRMHARFVPFAFVSSLRPLSYEPALEALAERVHGECLRYPPMRVESLTGREHVRVLQRRRYAALTLTHEEPHLGLSLSALESLVQGVPVVATANEEILAAYGEAAGGVLPPLVPDSGIAKVFAQALAHKATTNLARQWAERCFAPERLLANYIQAWRGNQLFQAA